MNGINTTNFLDCPISEKNKKCQMEILGLAMVVVLILVAAVFVARFIALKEPTDYRKGFVSAELASNMLNTLLKTTADGCFQTDMADLIEDCAQGSTIICSNGEDSCAFIESAASAIFSSTFDKWNMKYEFLVYTQNNPSVMKIGIGCPANKKSKLYLIPGSVTISAKLDICG